MARHGKERKGGPQERSFRAFLKKRAPIYLGLLGLFLVFAVPELTKGDLEGSFPELPAGEREIVDMLMRYDGGDGTGLTLIEAISSKIEEDYPDERIYDDRDTSVTLAVYGAGGDSYQVLLGFKAHKGEANYDWNIDAATGEITANNPESRHAVELVDYYD